MGVCSVEDGGGCGSRGEAWVLVRVQVHVRVQVRICMHTYLSAALAVCACAAPVIQAALWSCPDKLVCWTPHRCSCALSRFAIISTSSSVARLTGYAMCALVISFPHPVPCCLLLPLADVWSSTYLV